MMNETCANCGGMGMVSCNHCGGNGKMPNSSLIDQDCLECLGSGEELCPQCKGAGTLLAEILDPWEIESEESEQSIIPYE